MAMTGVRARRVDGTEVKLDTASYRLRDRFFGSRVGTRALIAVTFTLGRRGMALFQSSASDASSGGGTGAFSPQVVGRPFQKLYPNVLRSSAICVQHAKAEQIQLVSPPARVAASRNDKEGLREGCAEGSASGGVGSFDA